MIHLSGWQCCRRQTQFSAKVVGHILSNFIDLADQGDGYGIPNKEVFTTLMTAARQEGLLLDPVYSGKAFMGLIDQTNIGAFSDHEDVVFIHTGGAQSLNVYEAGIYAELAHSRSG